MIKIIWKSSSWEKSLDSWADASFFLQFFGISRSSSGCCSCDHFFLLDRKSSSSCFLNQNILPLLLLFDKGLLNYLHWLAHLFADNRLPDNLFFDHRFGLLMNNGTTLSFLVKDLFVRFVNHRSMHLMNKILVALMNNRLMNLTHFFLIDNRLMMFMNNWLMMLMNNILVVFMDNISVMLVNDISMRFLNNSSVHLWDNSWCYSMWFNYSLLDVSRYQNWLFMPNDCRGQICILNYRSRGCLN